MIYMKKYAFISSLLPLFFFHIASVFATEDLFITHRKIVSGFAGLVSVAELSTQYEQIKSKRR